MMKKISLLLFALIYAVSNVAWGQQNPFAPVQSKWEVVGTNVELNYHNSDYCDYYLVSSRNKELWVRPGLNNLVRVPREYAAKYRNDPTFLPSHFSTCKGYFPDKLNPDFLYALPVKSGDSTMYTLDAQMNRLTCLFRTAALDTIYAVRGGIVCKNETQGLRNNQINLENGKTLLVYHLDRSFALYGNFSKTFVREGEKISVGQAIGLSAKNSRIAISVFFLDKNKFKGGKPAGLPHTYFNPVFQTANAGNVKLEEGKTYVAQLTDEVLTQEMSKHEKSKYEKKKAGK